MTTGDSFDVQPFTISIPDEELEDMNERLRRTRFPQDFANDDWRYGYNGAYHRQMVEYWLEEYDWRDVERRMNELPHFKVDLMGVPLHFIHVKGKGPNPMPLLLHHGWPWTFWDVRKVIEPAHRPGEVRRRPQRLLRRRADLAARLRLLLAADRARMELVAHRRPREHADEGGAGLREVRHGRRRLGCAGDPAARSQVRGRRLRDLHPLPGADEPLPASSTRTRPPAWSTTPILGLPAASEYGEGEEGWFERGKLFVENESGYGEIQLTKPQTLAALVADSPGRPAGLDHREALLLGPGGARCRDGGVREGVAQGGPGHHRRGLLPHRDRRHLLALLLGVPGQPLEALARALPGGGRADRGEHLPRGDLQAAAHLDREVLQPAAVPGPRRRRALRAVGGARDLRRRRRARSSASSADRYAACATPARAACSRAPAVDDSPDHAHLSS